MTMAKVVNTQMLDIQTLHTHIGTYTAYFQLLGDCQCSLDSAWLGQVWLGKDRLDLKRLIEFDNLTCW
jgi:hypothetical protein